MTAVEAGKKYSQRIWIGLGIAALFCLCAVAFAAFVTIRAGQKVQEGFKTDPQAAAEAAHKIADYELPAGYQEEMAMDFFIYSMVVIDAGSTGKPTIMLAQFQTGADAEEMEAQIRQSFEQQAGRQGMSMTVVEVKEMTIRGAETEVTIYEGTDENGNTLRQLIAPFPGKDGTAMLMIMGSPEDWDQDEIDTFIESME